MLMSPIHQSLPTTEVDRAHWMVFIIFVVFNSMEDVVSALCTHSASNEYIEPLTVSPIRGAKWWSDTTTQKVYCIRVANQAILYWFWCSMCAPFFKISYKLVRISASLLKLVEETLS